MGVKRVFRGKRQNKKRTAACFGCFSSREAEKESQRKSWAERHWGTIRHHNNTHAGQEKSISISLTQKSTYGCNFIFFLKCSFSSSSSSSSPSSVSLSYIKLLKCCLRVENSSGKGFFFQQYINRCCGVSARRRSSNTSRGVCPSSPSCICSSLTLELH